MTLTTAGLRRAVRQLALELWMWKCHWLGVRRARRFRGTGLQLHLGSGPNYKEGWVNIDMEPRARADLALDLREPLPFADGSCQTVYSEHVLEHFDYPEPALSLLRESWRVLQAGGMLRVGVPDTDWLMAEYSGIRNEGYFGFAKKLWHPAWCETRMEHVNYHFRQGHEHRFAYDFETLAKALTGIGFTQVVRTDFDPRWDSEARRLGTLYVAAAKP